MFSKKYILFLTFMVVGNTSSALEIVETKPPLDLSNLTVTNPILVEPVEPSDCAVLKQLISKEMPEQVGDQNALESLMDARTENWFAKFDAKRFLELLEVTFSNGASLKTDPVGKIFDESSNAMLFYNLNKYEIRYVHRDRIFNEEVTTAFDAEKGNKLVQELLSSLGMSEEEANLQFLISKVLKAGTAPDLRSPPSLKNAVDVETTYFLPRMVNDLDVEESYYIVGISNEGMVSSFRIRWPILQMKSFDKMIAISKDEMMAKIYANLFASEVNCQEKPQQFTIKLAYVPSSASDGDENDNLNDIAGEIVFKLQLLVRYMPNSDYEGGNLQMFDVF